MRTHLLYMSPIPNDASQSKFPLDLKPSNACRCLGFWCTPTLSPKVSIDHNIENDYSPWEQKVCSINPLSGKAILNACVIPTCLSGWENWILNDALLSSLEAFQGYAARRIMGLSKFHSCLIPLIALGIPSMRARILSLKLFSLMDCLHLTTILSVLKPLEAFQTTARPP